MRNFDCKELPECSGQLQHLINFIRSRVPVEYSTPEWEIFLQTKVEDHLKLWRTELGATIKTRDDFNPFLPRLPFENRHGTINTRDSLVILNESPQKKVYPADDDEEETQEKVDAGKNEIISTPKSPSSDSKIDDKNTDKNEIEREAFEKDFPKIEKIQDVEENLEILKSRKIDVVNEIQTPDTKVRKNSNPKSDSSSSNSEKEEEEDNIFASKTPPKKSSVEIIEKEENNNSSSFQVSNTNGDLSFDLEKLKNSGRKIRFVRRRQNPETGSFSSDYSQEDSSEGDKLSFHHY